jgi:hypothetical protein
MTAVRKFLDEIVILYVPGGMDRSAIKPASLVSPTNSWFVAVFVAVTLAPGTTDPVGSATVPESEPVAMPCENPEVLNMRQNTLTSKTDQNCPWRSIDFVVEAPFLKNCSFANSFISFAPVNII